MKPKDQVKSNNINLCNRTKKSALIILIVVVGLLISSTIAVAGYDDKTNKEVRNDKDKKDISDNKKDIGDDGKHQDDCDDGKHQDDCDDGKDQDDCDDGKHQDDCDDGKDQDENSFNAIWIVINSINNTIVNIQNQINNIQLIPGPQGPKGDTGDAGQIGPQGPPGISQAYTFRTQYEDEWEYLGLSSTSKDVATLTLPEGNYLLFATFEARSIGTEYSEGLMECTLGGLSRRVRLAEMEMPGDHLTITLTSYITLTTNGTTSLNCRIIDGMVGDDEIEISYLSLIAMKIDQLN